MRDSLNRKLDSLKFVIFNQFQQIKIKSVLLVFFCEEKNINIVNDMIWKKDGDK